MEDVSEGDEGEDKQRACVRWNEKEGKPAVQYRLAVVVPRPYIEHSKHGNMSAYLLRQNIFGYRGRQPVERNRCRYKAGVNPWLAAHHRMLQPSLSSSLSFNISLVFFLFLFSFLPLPKP